MNVVRKKCDEVGCVNGRVALFTSWKPCKKCNGTGEIVENTDGPSEPQSGPISGMPNYYFSMGSISFEDDREDDI